MSWFCSVAVVVSLFREVGVKNAGAVGMVPVLRQILLNEIGDIFSEVGNRLVSVMCRVVSESSHVETEDGCRHRRRSGLQGVFRISGIQTLDNIVRVIVQRS
mgnify:CR=1 FL=1